MDLNKFFLKLKKNLERVFIFVRNPNFLLKLKELLLNLKNVFIIFAILSALGFICFINEINWALFIIFIVLIFYTHWLGSPFRHQKYKIKTKTIIQIKKFHIL